MRALNHLNHEYELAIARIAAAKSRAETRTC